MKNALWKDLFREIKLNKGRFLSIFCIVMLGTAFFSGLRSTGFDMNYSADRFYDDNALMDVRVVSTLGLTKEDLRDLAKIEGVAMAVGGRTREVILHTRDAALSIRTIGATVGINEAVVSEGRLPRNIHECLADADNFIQEGYRIGDTLTFESGDDEALEETMKTDTFTIVGMGYLPYYTDLTRGSGSTGDGSIDGFVLLDPAVYDMDIYTEAYLRVENADREMTFSEAYDDLVEAVTDRIDALSEVAVIRRYDQVYQEGMDAINDAKEKVRDGEKELSDAEKELSDGRKAIADAEKEIEDSEKEIADGWKEVADGKKELEDAQKELDDGKKQIREGQQTLKDKEKELEKAKGQVSAGEKAYREGLEKYSKSQAAYDEGMAQYQAGLAQYEEGLARYEEGLSQYEAGLERSREGREAYEEGLARYEEGLALYEENKAAWEGGLSAWQEADRLLSEKEAALEGALAALDPEAEDYEIMRSALEEQKGALAGARQELTLQKAALDMAAPELEAAEAELSATKKALDQAKEELDAGDLELAASKEVLDQTKETLDQSEAELSAVKSQLDGALALLTNGRKELEGSRKELESAKKQISSGESALKEGKKTLQKNQDKVNEGQKKIDDGWKDIRDAEKELKEGEEKLSDGKKELEDSRKELEDAQAEYDEAYPDAIKKIEDAKVEIADGEKELEELEVPEWYVLDRNLTESIVGYDQNADRMTSLGHVFPVIFFLVAALVSLTAMTRMVDEQRVQIGTLKALGYPDRVIAGRYLFYAMLATLTGGIIGIAFGEWFLPRLIIQSYGIMYTGMLYVFSPVNWDQALLGLGAAALCTGGATLLSCLGQLRAQPAELMRPEAPKSGRRIFLERIPFLWKGLNFTRKATLRNLTRYKKRFIMTVIGVGGCMALLLVGFGLHDSINEVAKNQYIHIFTQEASLSVDKKTSPEEWQNLTDAVKGYPGVTGAQRLSLLSVDLQHGGHIRTASLYIPEHPEEMGDFLKLRDRVSHVSYDFPEEGAVICEKTASMLDLSVGDMVTIARDGQKNVQIEVTAIAENYVLHYLFLSPSAYRSLYGEEPSYNSLYVNYEKKTPKEESDMGAFLMDLKGCTGVRFTTDLEKTIDDMLSILGNIVLVLIVSAGLLAFVVLYNLNSINIMERRRELATLKVLGFFDTEVAAYVYRENVLLTVFGILAGILFGTILHHYTIVTVEVDLMMFGRTIRPVSYLYSTLITFGFALLVNGAMYFSLKKVDMIESLKSVE